MYKDQAYIGLNSIDIHTLPVADLGGAKGAIAPPLPEVSGSTKE